MPLSALDDKTGKPVDWWFAYKLPNLTNAGKTKQGTALGAANGTEYLYCDANSPSLPHGLSPHPKILESGALLSTIQQLRARGKDSNIGWIFYNDEHGKIDKPVTDKKTGKPKITKVPIVPDNGAFGHTKGVVAFDLDTDSAFWLLHSWPSFPSFLPKSSKVLPPAPNFGQTFLCVTLKDVATLDAIAKVFHEQTQPQIIEMSLPKSLDAAKFPNIVQLSKDAPPAKVPPGAVEPSDTTFASKGGATFRLFAKSKDWLQPAATTVDEPKDLYSDLIGPTLKVDLEVETWQDGEPDDDSDHTHTTEDIMFIDLRALGINAGWHFTLHDHAKWAVSKDPDAQRETDWVIVADINRIDSQFERGGCGIAFQNKELARSLHSIIDMVPPPALAARIAAGEKAAKENEKTRDAGRTATMKNGKAAKRAAPAKKKTPPVKKTAPAKRRAAPANKKAAPVKRKAASARRKTAPKRKATVKKR